MENNLQIHRTKSEKADDLFSRHQGGLLQPPTTKELEQFPPLERFEFKIREKSDIVFEGLGWVTVKEGTIVAGYAPKGVGVLRRKAMI